VIGLLSWKLSRSVDLRGYGPLICTLSTGGHYSDRGFMLGVLYSHMVAMMVAPVYKGTFDFLHKTWSLFATLDTSFATKPCHCNKYITMCDQYEHSTLCGLDNFMTHVLWQNIGLASRG
jgi:hypothetical protein